MVSAKITAVNTTKRIFGEGAVLCSNSKSKSSETLYILQPQHAGSDNDVRTNCQNIICAKERQEMRVELHRIINANKNKIHKGF